MPEASQEKDQDQDFSRQLSMRKIILPVALGLLAAGWLLYNTLQEVKFVEAQPKGSGEWVWQDANGNGSPDLSEQAEFVRAEGGDYIRKSSWELLSEQEWDAYAFGALALALLMAVVRDVGYMYRMRVLTGNLLSWRQSFNVVMLWEFSSALTPSVVGGSGVAIWILNREGINLGKSTATIFVTAMMDEMFYILSVPIVFLLIGGDQLFPSEWAGEAFGVDAVEPLFYIGYGFIVLLTVSITLSLFLFPSTFKRILMRLFSFRILRKWRRYVTRTGQEIEMASDELKGRPFSYWFKAFGATIVSWTARFFTLNFIILAFVQPIDHAVIYGRQMTMWVIMLISPTPGSSGVAEYFFSVFFSDVVKYGALILLIVLIWRFLTYFLYLIMGVVVMPRWFRSTQKKAA